MLKLTPGRMPYGWNGREFTNGEEGDWLLDLSYLLAQLDKRIAHGQTPRVYTRCLAIECGEHLAMSLPTDDDDVCPEFVPAIHAMLARYHRAYAAVMEVIAEDQQKSKPQILTKEFAPTVCAKLDEAVEELVQVNRIADEARPIELRQLEFSAEERNAPRVSGSKQVW